MKNLALSRSTVPESITVIGLGLLGASLAEGAARRWPGLRITGVSSPPTLEAARRAGIIHSAHAYDQLDSALLDADIVFLCTPIDHIKAVLAAWVKAPPATKEGCVVSDVGSTKAEICALGRLAFRPTHKQGAVFIGSHPMAGSEKTGLEARDPLLFENASWVLCPEPDAPESAVKRLQGFIDSLGGRSARMTSDLHDKVAAHVSHLPQLLSTALASFIGGRDAVLENCLRMAGGGFRDMTRLAGSSFAVWEPILRSNQAEVDSALAAFTDHLAAIARGLPETRAADAFKEGGKLRSKLSTSRKGFSLPPTEILVDLEDKPGALLQALSPLAERGLNVADLEILKVREGEAGTMMMGFRRPEEAGKALHMLAAAGLRARLR